MSTNLMTRNAATRQIAEGMTAYGSDGEKLGAVRNYDPEAGYLDIQTGWLFHRDFYVGLAAVASVDKDGITLRLVRQDLDDDRFATPPVVRGALGGADSATTIPTLPEAQLPFDTERTALTVTRVVTREPIREESPLVPQQMYQQPAPLQAADGMAVYDRDREKLGTVRNVNPHAGYFDVQRGRLFDKDFYVLMADVTTVDEHGIVLRLSKQDLDDRFTAPPTGGVTYGDSFAVIEKEPLDVTNEEVPETRASGMPVH